MTLFKKTLCHWALFFSLCVINGLANAIVDFIPNGSFEARAFNTSGDAATTSIEGWRRIRGDITIARSSRRGIEPFDGNSMLFIQGYETARINSLAPTLSGQSYRLAFYAAFSEPSHIDANEHVLDVFINGVLERTIETRSCFITFLV